MEEEIPKTGKILENEAELVEKAKNDDQAFSQLYDFYFPRVYGYIFKRVGNHEAAEDIVSVTFMKVFTHIKSYQSQGYTFGAWVYRIATNNLIDHYRKEGKRKEVNIDDVYHLHDEQKSPEERMQISYEYNLVQKVIANLSPKYQEILHLKFFAEMTTAEISQSLGITENNVRVILFRALKNFNKVYEKYRK